VGGEDEGDGGAVFDDVGDDDRILYFLYVCPFLFVVGLRNGFEVEQFILIPPCSPSPAEQATSFATNIMPLPPTGSQQRQPSSTSSPPSPSPSPSMVSTSSLVATLRTRFHAHDVILHFLFSPAKRFKHHFQFRAGVFCRDVVQDNACFRHGALDFLFFLPFPRSLFVFIELINLFHRPRYLKATC
jgi:hypothetical protein